MTLADAIQSASPMGRKLICTRVADTELQDTTLGGIIMPDQSVDLHQRHMQAEIVAVGPDVEEGALLPGFRVLLRRYSQHFLGDDGDYFVVAEPDVLAILNV